MTILLRTCNELTKIYINNTSDKKQTINTAKILMSIYKTFLKRFPKS